MDRLMTKQESYVKRRNLFRNIWETSMYIDEKEEIMNKPKVIKTLKLDEVGNYPVGKTKRQRIKNLRHVCNKILDFCDRQEADDIYYEQIKQMASRNADAEPQTLVETAPKLNKMKTSRTRKKIRTTKSLFAPRVEIAVPAAISEKEELDAVSLKKFETSGKMSPVKAKRPKAAPEKSVKTKLSPDSNKSKKLVRSADVPGEASVPGRKIVNKHRVKRKKKSVTGAVVARGGINWPDL